MRLHSRRLWGNLSPEKLGRLSELADARMEVLSHQVNDLQQMVASQARSLSTLLDVLEGRGVLSREEYTTRLRTSRP